MVKIAVSGHFCFKKELFNGQTIKTKLLADILDKEFGTQSIMKIDTHGGLFLLPKMIFDLLKAFICCNTIIMLPAHNGIKIFAPMFVTLGKMLKRNILYVVIGGWLPEMTKQKKWLAFFLKKFDGIYVETDSMKIALEEQSFNNIFVMPNFKELNVLKKEELVYTTQAPFSFCMFSRVMKEKGIEEAIEAINKLNEKKDDILVTLDIYGQIADNYKIRFEQLQNKFPNYIQYKGIVFPNESVNILKKYFLLLFPTYYEGEGFAGTLIDAMASGVPVIASDWKYNKEIVVEGKTGVIIHSSSSLLNEIKNAIENPEKFNLMKTTCLKNAQKYTPKNAVKLLLEHIR